MERRTFLKIVGTAGVVAASGEVIMAGGATAPPDGLGVLVDLTACLGCRTCEYMCAEANGLPEPAEEAGEGLRETSESQFTVVSSFDTNAGPVFVKRQCMHCNQPACTSACLTKALVKTEEGPVVWRADKCMGCRYCMISCPFDVPKFEFNSPVPRIRKCTLCWERLGRGENPACVENCPNEALLFGKRSELLEEARKRIYQNPDQYVSHIYGEHEAGGTGVLYISPVPFEELEFPTDLGTTPFPEYNRNFLTAVPVVLTLWPAFMLALRQASDRSLETRESPLSAPAAEEV